jgi:short chain dehydrogenase
VLVVEVELSADPSSNTVRCHRRAYMTTPVVVITGALTGIGRATALAFAQEGARIVVSGRHDEAGHAPTQELRARGVEAEFVLADVRHEDDVRKLVDKTVPPSAGLMWRSTMPAPKASPVRDGTDRRKLRGYFRHQCARRAAQHDA